MRQGPDSRTPPPPLWAPMTLGGPQLRAPLVGATDIGWTAAQEPPPPLVGATDIGWTAAQDPPLWAPLTLGGPQLRSPLVGATDIGWTAAQDPPCRRH
ncbi:hypothetical protein TNCV_4660021 [Trichonephila clavipes]|uniref:Uncharacterized protein n=1 Tax=Trichonephila clavipes TaxID=2585209 RepID=A0A8X6VDP4_TRICX|nr:hypothetical protein TNCV_4660021 [Trichonephila clavipes]